MPQDGPRGHLPIVEEELPALEHKRMLARQAEKLFTLWIHLVVPATVVAFVSILVFMIQEPEALEQYSESLRGHLRLAGSFLELGTVLWLLIFFAGFLLAYATHIVNGSSVSRDLNTLVHSCLQGAGWITLSTAFSAMVGVFIFGLRMVGILPLSGIVALVVVLIMLVIMIGVFIATVIYITLWALGEWGPRLPFFVRFIKCGIWISPIPIIVTSILYMALDLEFFWVIISLGFAALLEIIALIGAVISVGVAWRRERRN